jgi:hypothetical protein
MLRNPGLRKSVEQPVLDLNFAAAQIGSNAAPDSRIDFSRGTNAWFVDSDGLVKKSPHNLITQSEAINSSPWFVTGSTTITANSITAPDGTLTADKLEKGAIAFQAVISGFTGAGVNDYAASFFVKEGTLDEVSLLLSSDSASTLNARIIFDLTAETATDFGSTNLKSTSIVDVGDGWYRCTVEATFTNQTSPFLYIYPGSYNQSTAGFVYIWGVQVSQHTTLPVDNPYIKTEGDAHYAARLDHDPSWFMSAAQEQNLLEYSEMLDDSGWTKNSVSVTANAETDPLGGTTAEYIFATSPSGDFPSIQGSFDTKKGAVHTVSFYAKAGEIDVVSVGIRTSSGGYVSDPFSNQALTSEWQRFSGTFTATEDTHLVRFFFGSGAKTWTGDQGFYIWGTQIEVGSTASTYHRTEGAPYYGPGATPKGLLIEEARTNDATESDTFNPQAGTTRAADNALAPDGTITADTLTIDSAGGAHQTKPNPSPTVLSSTTYTMSVFVKLINGTPNIGFRGYGNGAVNAYPIFDLANKTAVRSGSSWSNAKVEDYGNGWLRCSATTTSSGTNEPIIHFLASGDESGTTNYTGNGTDAIAFWGFQQEAGSFPTSYIQTTGNSKTRNADVAVMGPTTGGTELVTNGTFDTDSDWTLPSGGNVTIASGVLDYSSAAQYKRTIQSLASSLAVGRRYRASFEVTSFTSGLVAMRYFENGSLVTASDNRGAVGTTTFDFTCTTLTGAEIDIRSQASGSNTFQIDNISVRELYPFEQYRPDQGTMVVAFDTQSDASRGPWWFSRGGANSTGWGLRLRSTTTIDSMIRDSSNFNTLSDLTLTPDFDIVAASYEQRASDTFCSVATATDFDDDGHENDIDVSVDTLDIGQCKIGGTDTGIMSGHIKRLQYFPIAMNDETKLKNMCDD